MYSENNLENLASQDANEKSKEEGGEGRVSFVRNGVGEIAPQKYSQISSRFIIGTYTYRRHGGDTSIIIYRCIKINRIRIRIFEVGSRLYNVSIKPTL